MDLKIVAPALAALFLAGSAHAQEALSPEPDVECIAGQPGCPAPLEEETALQTGPLQTGRAATSAPMPGDGSYGYEGTPAERNSPAAQLVNPLIEPNDQGSSKD